MRGGDQRVVNVLLKDPERAPGLEPLRWALFPPELMTHSADQQRGMMYKDSAGEAAYHLNDFGGASTAPEKARENKMAMLAHHDKVRADALAKNAAAIAKYAQFPPPWDR